MTIVNTVDIIILDINIICLKRYLKDNSKEKVVMKRFLGKAATLFSLLTALVLSGCFSAFAAVNNSVDYETGQNNSLVVICSVIIIVALLAIIIMLIAKRRKNK